jgi:hypothetical protein
VHKVGIRMKSTLEVSNIHPRTGHEGPEGEKRYRCTLSLTLALNRGGWSTPCSGRFTTGNDAVANVLEAGWVSGPVWTGAENLALRRYTIPGPTTS